MAGFLPNFRDKCPYCQTVVKFEAPNTALPKIAHLGVPMEAYRTESPKEHLLVIPSFCPNCLKTIIALQKQQEIIMIWPLVAAKQPAPEEIPENIANDFNEAAIVLQFSPKASAALSRRCLQTILREAGKTKSHELSQQIDEVKGNLPPYIWHNLDYVREIGNFATHEQKSINTGLVIDVEPGEAEWNLDVIEALFDFYYVDQAREKKKREDLDLKIKDAGRKPISTE